MAYRFLRWRHERGLELESIDPVRTANYLRQLQGELSPPSVKQHLAGIKHLFGFFGFVAQIEEESQLRQYTL